MTNDEKITFYAEALHLALSEVSPKDADMVVENLVGIMQSRGDLVHFKSVVEKYEIDYSGKSFLPQDFSSLAGLENNEEVISKLNSIAKEKSDEEFVILKEEDFKTEN